MSNIYSSQAGFQPQDLVKRRLPASNEAFQADREPVRRNFVGRPLAAKPPPPVVEPPEEDDASVVSVETTEEENLEDDADEDMLEDEAENHISPAEIEQLVSDAYQRGRRIGVSEGREQVKDDFDAAITVVLNIGQELDSLRQTILENSQKELQNLALAIAEKVTRRSVKEQSETIIHTVEEAIRLAISSEEITVLVNPADFETVMTKSDEVKAGIAGLRTLNIRADESIERGGCRLESNNCLVDATMAGQLADIAFTLQLQTES